MLNTTPEFARLENEYRRDAIAQSVRSGGRSRQIRDQRASDRNKARPFLSWVHLRTAA